MRCFSGSGPDSLCSSLNMRSSIVGKVAAQQSHSYCKGRMRFYYWFLPGAWLYSKEIDAGVAQGIPTAHARISTSLTDAHVTVIALDGQLAVTHAGVADDGRSPLEPLGHFPAMHSVAFQCLDLPELLHPVQVGILLLVFLLCSLEEQVHCAVCGQGREHIDLRSFRKGRDKDTYCILPAFSSHSVCFEGSRLRST